MTDDNTTSRRDFIKGVATGVIGGGLAGMGLYSYTNSAYSRLPKAARAQTEFGVVRSDQGYGHLDQARFNNAHLMEDIMKAGGLLVDQYTIGWGPFGNGKGAGKSSYEEGISSIRKMLRATLRQPGPSKTSSPCTPKIRAVSRPTVEVEDMDGSKHKYLWLVLHLDGSKLQARRHRPDAQIGRNRSTDLTLLSTSTTSLACPR